MNWVDFVKCKFHHYVLTLFFAVIADLRNFRMKFSSLKYNQINTAACTAEHIFILIYFQTNSQQLRDLFIFSSWSLILGTFLRGKSFEYFFILLSRGKKVAVQCLLSDDYNWGNFRCILNEKFKFYYFFFNLNKMRFQYCFSNLWLN